MKAALLLVLALGQLAATPAPPPEPHIAGIEARVDGSRVVVSLDLAGAVGDRFAERVESGLPTSFVYRFELVLGRRFWWDKTLAKSELEITATYDATTRDYMINHRLDGKLVESRAARTFEDLVRGMTHLEAVPVFSLADAPPGSRLRVRVKAELGARTILSIIPSQIETGWADSDRFQAPSP